MSTVLGKHTLCNMSPVAPIGHRSQPLPQVSNTFPEYVPHTFVDGRRVRLTEIYFSSLFCISHRRIGVFTFIF